MKMTANGESVLVPEDCVHGEDILGNQHKSEFLDTCAGKPGRFTLDLEQMSQRKNHLSRSTVHMEGDEKEAVVT